MLLCPRGSQLHENHFAPQPLEITPFRLTPPFRLAYTDFIGPKGDFQRSPGNTNICMTFLARFVRFLFWLLVAASWDVAWCVIRFAECMWMKRSPFRFGTKVRFSTSAPPRAVMRMRKAPRSSPQTANRKAGRTRFEIGPSERTSYRIN